MPRRVNPIASRRTAFSSMQRQMSKSQPWRIACSDMAAASVLNTAASGTPGSMSRCCDQTTLTRSRPNCSARWRPVKNSPSSPCQPFDGKSSLPTRRRRRIRPNTRMQSSSICDAVIHRYLGGQEPVNRLRIGHRTQNAASETADCASWSETTFARRACQNRPLKVRGGARVRNLGGIPSCGNLIGIRHARASRLGTLGENRRKTAT